MKDKDFQNIIELGHVGGGFVPANEKARELEESCSKGEIISVIEVTQRDLKFHKCYMSLLGYIYDYLPRLFHNKVSKKKFYLWLKHLKGQYDVLYEFNDGTKLVEYESISFGNMSEKRFHEYIKEQLPWIYENVIGKFFEGEIFNGIIDTIENEYMKFFSKL